MSLIFFLILLGQLHVQYNLVSWTQPYWYNVLPRPLLRHKGCIWDVSLAMPQIPLLYSTVAKITVFFGSGLILLSYGLLEVAFPSYKSTLQIKLFTYQYFSLPIDFQLSFWCRLPSWEESPCKIDWRWNKRWQTSPCCELRLHNPRWRQCLQCLGEPLFGNLQGTRIIWFPEKVPQWHHRRR